MPSRVIVASQFVPIGRPSACSRRALLRAALSSGAGLALTACGSATAMAVTSTAVGARSLAPAPAASTVSASPLVAPAITRLLVLLRIADPGKKIWQHVVDAYQQVSHQPTVELFNPGNPYIKFNAMIAGGAGPDLFGSFETKRLPYYVGVDATLNMDPYLARSHAIKPTDFFPSTWSKHVVNGQFSAMPTTNATVVLFYNLDRFQEAGVTPPPKQWGAQGWDTAAFLDAGHKLTRTAGQPQAESNAVSTRAGPGGVDTPEVVSTLQWLADLTWKEHVQPTVDEAKASTPLFVNGKLAVEGTSANLASAYRQQIKGFRWDVGALPTGTHGVWTRIPTISTFAWKGTKQPDAAWGLAEFLGGETAQLILGLGGQGVPTRTTAARSPKFLKQPNGIDWQVLVDAADHEGILPVTDVYPEMDNLISKELAPLWAGRQTAQQVTTALKPLLAQLLSTSKVRRDRTPYWQEHGWASATK
jgi:multiple sugar transport system substrate-binding protein